MNSSSALASLRHTVVTFTAAQRVPQARAAKRMYAGGKPQFAAIHGCASQVTVEPATDSGIAWAAVKSTVTGDRGRGDRICQIACNFYVRVRESCSSRSTHTRQLLFQFLPTALTSPSAARAGSDFLLPAIFCKVHS